MCLDSCAYLLFLTLAFTATDFQAADFLGSSGSSCSFGYLFRGERRLLACERLDAGQFFTFEKLKACSAAGRDVLDLIGHARLLDGCH